MNNKKIGIGMLLVTLLTAAAALVLRLMMNTEFEDGVLRHGAWTPIALFALFGAAIVVLAVLTSRLGRQQSYAATLGGKGWTALAAGAGAGMVLCNALLWNAATGKMDQITCIVGALGGLGLLVHGLLRAAGKKSSLWVMLPLCLWAITNLICNYQTWSRDPVVADYCFSTLADATMMLMIYHASAFVHNKGKRRMAALWSCLAFTFGLLSVLDQPLKAGVPVETVMLLVGGVCACLLVGCGLRWVGALGGKAATAAMVLVGMALCLTVPVLLIEDAAWDFARFGVRMSMTAMAFGMAVSLCLRTDDDPTEEKPAAEEPAAEEPAIEEPAPSEPDEEA